MVVHFEVTGESKGKLGAFEDTFAAATPFAYRNVHKNQLNFDYQKTQFKFKWKEGVTEAQKHAVTYLVIFKPEDNPDTEENESIHSVINNCA